MKIFLSALESSVIKKDINNAFYSEIINNNFRMKYNLMCFFYIKDIDIYNLIVDNTDEVLIDSGAHSFQKGKKVDWEKYTNEYVTFIKNNDRKNILGYFEMDVDNIIGYEKVLKLRKILEEVSDKIIPVWHKNRGVSEYKKMCKQYAGKIVAITGFKNEDIKDDQYLMFIKEAKKYNCKIHCLGLTRKKLLDTIPFDYVDSSSWKQEVIFGRLQNKKIKRDSEQSGTMSQYLLSYKLWMKKQSYYEKRFL